jgi:hypothetical protein
MDDYYDKLKMSGGRHRRIRVMKRKIMYPSQKQGQSQKQRGGNTLVRSKPTVPTWHGRPNVTTFKNAPTRSTFSYNAPNRAQNTLRATRSTPQFRGQTFKPQSTSVKYGMNKWFGGKMRDVTRRKRKISRKSRKHHKTTHHMG